MNAPIVPASGSMRANWKKFAPNARPSKAKKNPKPFLSGSTSAIPQPAPCGSFVAFSATDGEALQLRKAPAAVGEDFLAGEGGAGVAGEEESDLGDFVRLNEIGN